MNPNLSALKNKRVVRVRALYITQKFSRFFVRTERTAQGSDFFTQKRSEGKMLSERFCVLIMFLESVVQEVVVEDAFLFIKCVNRCFYRAEQSVGELFEFCFRRRSQCIDFVPIGVGALVGNFVVSLQSLRKHDEFLFKFFRFRFFGQQTLDIRRS